MEVVRDEGGGLGISPSKRRIDGSRTVGQTREAPRIVGSGRRSEGINPQAAKEPLVIAYRRIGVGERKDRMHVESAKCDPRSDRDCRFLEGQVARIQSIGDSAFRVSSSRRLGVVDSRSEKSRK